MKLHQESVLFSTPAAAVFVPPLLNADLPAGVYVVVLDADGTVVDVWDLSPAGLEQPEGLAFLPNGDALVSSEGTDGPAVILRFTYRPAP